jgi:hypothetical protein
MGYAGSFAHRAGSGGAPGQGVVVGHGRCFERRDRSSVRVHAEVCSDWNDSPEPFVWTTPADEILDKVARGQATLDRITKSATHH